MQQSSESLCLALAPHTMFHVKENRLRKSSVANRNLIINITPEIQERHTHTHTHTHTQTHVQPTAHINSQEHNNIKRGCALQL